MCPRLTRETLTASSFEGWGAIGGLLRAIRESAFSSIFTCSFRWESSGANSGATSSRFDDWLYDCWRSSSERSLAGSLVRNEISLLRFSNLVASCSFLIPRTFEDTFVEVSLVDLRKLSLVLKVCSAYRSTSRTANRRRTCQLPSNLSRFDR